MAPDSTAARFRAALERLGLSRQDAATLLGVSKGTVGQVCDGKRQPTLDWLHAAALRLHVDPAALDPRLASTAPRPPAPARWVGRQDLTDTPLGRGENG